MTREESKLEILKKVENGVLSVEEGSALLGILDKAERPSVEPEIVKERDEEFTEPVETPKVSGCWKAAWSMILFRRCGADGILSFLGLPGLYEQRIWLGLLALVDSTGDWCVHHGRRLDPARISVDACACSQRRRGQENQYRIEHADSFWSRALGV